MPAQPSKPAHVNSSQTPSRSVSKVLLVGGEDFLVNRASSHVYFGGQRARVVGKAVKLSDALPRLKSGEIDIVWLSRIFSSEELLHFAFDAKDSGYQGVILQAQSGVVSSDPGTPRARKPIRAGDFVIDLHKYRVWVRGKDTQLTPQEFALLSYFTKHPRQLLTHEHLLATLWGNNAAPIAPLRVLIQTLRTKIEMTAASPRYIVTQYRLGYRFNPSPYPLLDDRERQKLSPKVFHKSSKPDLDAFRVT